MVHLGTPRVGPIHTQNIGTIDGLISISANISISNSTAVEFTTTVTLESGHFHYSDPSIDHHICTLETINSSPFSLRNIGTSQSFDAAGSNENNISNLTLTLQWALLRQLHWNPAYFITVTHTSSAVTLKSGHFRYSGQQKITIHES